MPSHLDENEIAAMIVTALIAYIIRGLDTGVWSLRRVGRPAKVPLCPHCGTDLPHVNDVNPERKEN